MSILSTTKHYKNYITDSNGDHSLTSYYTESGDVIVDTTDNLSLADSKVFCTQFEYNTWESDGTLKSNVEYWITDASHETVVTAEDVSYNNTTSGLTSTDTQGAIDELKGLLGDQATFTLDGTTLIITTK